jgi:GGDEF domain-containing protein
MKYDVTAARAAGVSDDDIMDELQSAQPKYRVRDAFKSGVSLEDIAQEIDKPSTTIPTDTGVPVIDSSMAQPKPLPSETTQWMPAKSTDWGKVGTAAAKSFGKSSVEQVKAVSNFVMPPAFPPWEGGPAQTPEDRKQEQEMGMGSNPLTQYIEKEAEPFYALTADEQKAIKDSGVVGPAAMAITSMIAQAPTFAIGGAGGAAAFKALAEQFGKEAVIKAMPTFARILQNRGQGALVKSIMENASSMGLSEAAAVSAEGTATPQEAAKRIFGATVMGGVTAPAAKIVGGMARVIPEAVKAPQVVQKVVGGLGEVAGAGGGMGAYTAIMDPNATRDDLIQALATGAIMHGMNLPLGMRRSNEALRKFKDVATPENQQAVSDAIRKDISGMSKEEVDMQMEGIRSKIKNGTVPTLSKDATEEPRVETQPNTDQTKSQQTTKKEIPETKQEPELQPMSQVVRDFQDQVAAGKEVTPTEPVIPVKTSSELAMESTVQKPKKKVDLSHILNPQGEKDEVYGRYNRKAMDAGVEALSEAVNSGDVQKAAHYQFDIVNLGQMNTEIGHDKANEVLKEINEIVNKNLDEFFNGKRVQRVDYKPGGDELAGNIIGASKDELQPTIDKIEKEVKEYVENKKIIKTDGSIVNLSELTHPKHEGMKTGAGYLNIGVVDYKNFTPEELAFLQKEENNRAAKTGEKPRKMTPGIAIILDADALSTKAKNVRLKESSKKELQSGRDFVYNKRTGTYQNMDGLIGSRLMSGKYGNKIRDVKKLREQIRNDILKEADYVSESEPGRTTSEVRSPSDGRGYPEVYGDGGQKQETGSPANADGASKHNTEEVTPPAPAQPTPAQRLSDPGILKALNTTEEQFNADFDSNSLKHRNETPDEYGKGIICQNRATAPKRNPGRRRR